MSKFNVGDRVVIVKSNLPHYVGEKATVTGPSDIVPRAVSLTLDDPSIVGPYVQSAEDGSIPWMEDWLEKE